jgi:hypothetical protein
LSPSDKQHRTQLLPGQQPGQKAPERQESLPDFEQVVQGAEFSPEVAEGLVPQLGNEAVLALLAQGSALSQVDQEQEEEGLALEEALPEHELEIKAIFGGGGGSDGAGDGEANPWEVGKMFGGPEDPRASRSGPAGPAMSAPASRGGGGPQHTGEADPPLPPDAFDRITRALGTSPPLRPEDRRGDARYQAVEAGLRNPLNIGKRRLQAEAMVDHTGHLDPIGRCAAIGRFLGKSATTLEARVLGRVLGGPASGLLPQASGYAGAAARLAALAVATEATEGAWEHTDRCVALSLVRDAWPDAVLAARKAAQSRRLVAPDIFGLALGSPQPPDSRVHTTERLRPTVATVRLGAAALGRVIPASQIPTIPPVRSHASPQPLVTDPEMAAADAALARFTGGASPADLPPDPVLSPAAMRPLLDAATDLINGLGRAQVELAAAALAIERIRPGTAVQQILVHGDKALRTLAKSVVQSGDRLHKARGTPLSRLGSLPADTHRQLQASAQTLRGLQAWATSALAQELSQ